eukprot:4061102-Pyramimonas_sp.AAC.1
MANHRAMRKPVEDARCAGHRGQAQVRKKGVRQTFSCTLEMMSPTAGAVRPTKDLVSVSGPLAVRSQAQTSVINSAASQQGDSSTPR